MGSFADSLHAILLSQSLEGLGRCGWSGSEGFFEIFTVKPEAAPLWSAPKAPSWLGSVNRSGSPQSLGLLTALTG
jgi:hypothetical protein